MLNNDDINTEIEQFQLLCLTSRAENKLECIKHRIDITGLFNMTPEEEQFKWLFNHEQSLVRDMDDLTLRAHRETLIKVIREAKIKVLAVDEDIKQKCKKKFTDNTRSVNIDEASSDAITLIKKRQGKIDKFDKIREGLIKMGMDVSEADKVMSARGLLDSKRAQNNTPPPSIESMTGVEVKKVFNPFKKE